MTKPGFSSFMFVLAGGSFLSLFFCISGACVVLFLCFPLSVSVSGTLWLLLRVSGTVCLTTLSLQSRCHSSTGYLLNFERHPHLYPDLEFFLKDCFCFSFSVVNISDCLERLVSEMTSYMSS